MKTITIGICAAVNDPQGLGRIRYKSSSTNPGNIEGAFDYTNWDDKDPFIAIPFLPLSINHVPEVGQSVKIITYDGNKDLVNVEYIAGPHTTRHDFNTQTYTDSMRYTTFGNSGKEGPKVFNVDGTYVNKKAEGAFAKPEHHGLYGMYGSDLIFTENGLNLRGGKLPTKEFASANDRKELLSQPILSDNIATLQLKKFPKKINLVEEEITEKVFDNGQLRYLVEYEIVDFTGKTNINFYIYKTSNEGSQFSILNPKLEEVEITTGSTLVKVVSNFNEDTNFKISNKSFIVSTSLSDNNGLSDAEKYVMVRDIIKGFNNQGFEYFNDSTIDTIVHPFYFRPTKNTTKDFGNDDYNSKRDLILEKIIPFFNKPAIYKKGLVYSKDKPDVPYKENTKKQKVLKEDDKKREHTFASLKGDKIYLLSTDTNEVKPVNFKKLEKYEHTQENYVKDIDPNTYALVRGEVLVAILKTMAQLFESHQHQPTEPLVKSDKNFITLQKQINSLENDLLNNSIRIN
jgi:hypothetical protein